MDLSYKKPRLLRGVFFRIVRIGVFFHVHPAYSVCLVNPTVEKKPSQSIGASSQNCIKQAGFQLPSAPAPSPCPGSLNPWAKASGAGKSFHGCRRAPAPGLGGEFLGWVGSLTSDQSVLSSPGV